MYQVMVFACGDSQTVGLFSSQPVRTRSEKVNDRCEEGRRLTLVVTILVSVVIYDELAHLGEIAVSEISLSIFLSSSRHTQLRFLRQIYCMLKKSKIDF